MSSLQPKNFVKCYTLPANTSLNDSIYIDSPVLRCGLVLADLPGLQDTNLARLKATQDYLMQCHNVFIIAKISRAITDQSLKSSLYYVLSKHAPLEWEASAGREFKLAVICTRSEDINMDRARSEFVGQGKIVQPKVMEDLDRDIKEAKEACDRARKKKLKREYVIYFQCPAIERLLLTP